MKKLMLILACVSLVWGCREKNIPVVYPGPIALGYDSTYLGPTTVTTIPHNVLVEEFTGQGCGNCPAAHTTLDAIASAPGNVGRVNIMSMYYTGGSQTTPPTAAVYDFRNAIATNISNSIYNNVSVLPSAGIDRTSYDGAMVQFSTTWSRTVDIQKALIDSMNLGISSSYNATTHTATIVDTVTYTQNVYSKQNVSIFLIEDSLVDVQEDNTASSGFDDNYLFKDIFRDMVSSPFLGDGVLDTMAMKPMGQVYWRRYTYTVDITKVNPAHCRIVAAVNNPGTGGDYHVLQSVQCKLAQ